MCGCFGAALEARNPRRFVPDLHQAPTVPHIGDERNLTKPVTIE
jgi:hypothetical protein